MITFSIVLSVGTSYISSSIILSSTDLNPLAPVLSFIAILATSTIKNGDQVFAVKFKDKYKKFTSQNAVCEYGVVCNVKDFRMLDTGFAMATLEGVKREARQFQYSLF